MPGALSPDIPDDPDLPALRAIYGEFCGGGPVKLERGNTIKNALSALRRHIGNKAGEVQGQRFERALDETSLDRYDPDDLRYMFTGEKAAKHKRAYLPDLEESQAGLLTSMPPAAFENFSKPITSGLDLVPYPQFMGRDALSFAPKGERTYERYLDYLNHVSETKGLNQTPRLWLGKDIDDLTQIGGHEGRHRSRMLARDDSRPSLVNLRPLIKGELNNRSPEEIVEHMQGKYFPDGTDTMIDPEYSQLLQRKLRQFPYETYAEGGEVRGFAEGGSGRSGFLVKMLKNLRGQYGPEVEKSMDLTRAHTQRTGNEALVMGHQGVPEVSDVVPGGKTNVSLPDWYERYARSEPGSQFFTTHTHPGEALSPSAQDISLYANRYHDDVPWQDMFIQAPNSGAALRLGALNKTGAGINPTMLSRLVDDLKKNSSSQSLDPAIARKVVDGVMDFTRAHGVDTAPFQGRGNSGAFNRYINELEAGRYLNNLSRFGVDTSVDASHLLPGTKVLAADAWPEYIKQQEKIIGYADGGFVEGEDDTVRAFSEGGRRGILTRLVKSIRGKPDTFKLPGGETMQAQPIKEFEDISNRFASRHGNTLPSETGYPAFDEDRARRIAEAYEAAQHAPGDPAVRRSYDALIDETMDQYKALKDTGVDFQFQRPGEAGRYDASPALTYKDLVENGRLQVFPTHMGYGNATMDIADNPLLKNVGRIGDMDNATANDAFRVVHDALGHLGPGNPMFRAPGEERAWLAHRPTFSSDALPALTSETRGQNSWVNFGPKSGSNKSASQAATDYAPQKATILPSWVMDDYAEGGEVRGFSEGGGRGAILKQGLGALRRAMGKSDVIKPKNTLYSDIYEQDPRDIVQLARERIAPEDPSMLELFGHTRESLLGNYGQRAGNTSGLDYLPPVKKQGSGSEAVHNLMTDRNTQRIVDTLAEAGKVPELKHADAWYAMDPAYNRLRELHGDDEADDIYRRFNTATTGMSPSSGVKEELERGTIAHRLLTQGKEADLFPWAGMGEDARLDPEVLRKFGPVPESMKNFSAHPYFSSAVEPGYRRAFMNSGTQATKPKVSLYAGASGVPSTGFQTDAAVPDRHFARGIRLPNTRTNSAPDGPVSMAEARTILPWWKSHVADALGEQAVPMQARMWTMMGPLTGVQTDLGAPKLELLSRHIMDEARRTGGNPHDVRDAILSGKDYAEGGSVDDDMLQYHPIAYDDGGPVQLHSENPDAPTSYGGGYTTEEPQRPGLPSRPRSDFLPGALRLAWRGLPREAQRAYQPMAKLAYNMTPFGGAEGTIRAWGDFNDAYHKGDLLGMGASGGDVALNAMGMVPGVGYVMNALRQAPGAARQFMQQTGKRGGLGALAEAADAAGMGKRDFTIAGGIDALMSILGVVDDAPKHYADGGQVDDDMLQYHPILFADGGSVDETPTWDYQTPPPAAVGPPATPFAEGGVVNRVMGALSRGAS